LYKNRDKSRLAFVSLDKYSYFFVKYVILFQKYIVEQEKDK